MTDYAAVATDLSERVYRDFGWQVLNEEHWDVKNARDMILARVALAVGDSPLLLVSSTSEMGDYVVDCRLVAVTKDVIVEASVRSNHSRPEVELRIRPLRITTFDVDTNKMAFSDSAWPGSLRLTLSHEDGSSLELPLSATPDRREYSEVLTLLEHVRGHLS